LLDKDALASVFEADEVIGVPRLRMFDEGKLTGAQFSDELGSVGCWGEVGTIAGRKEVVTTGALWTLFSLLTLGSSSSNNTDRSMDWVGLMLGRSSVGKF